MMAGDGTEVETLDSILADVIAEHRESFDVEEETEEEPKPKADSKEASAEKKTAADDTEEDEEEGKKTPPAHRDWMKLRKARTKLIEREKAMESRVNELAAKAAERLAPFQRIADALDSGDWDSLAAEIAAAKKLEFKDWNGLNGHIVKRFASPEHKEILRLRQAQEERDRRDAEREAASKKQTIESQQAQRRAAYLEDLGGNLKEHEDPIISKAAEDKEFSQAVYQEQAKAWDQDSGTTITVEEAANRAIKKARKNYERLAALFGDQAPNPAKRPPSARNSRVGSTRTVPARRSVQASSNDDAASPDELIKLYAKKMRDSYEEEGRLR